MAEERSDGHARHLGSPGAALVPRNFSRAGTPVAVEDPSPLSRFGRIIGDSYWQPKARGMWVRGDLGGCCLQKRQRDAHLGAHHCAGALKAISLSAWFRLGIFGRPLGLVC